MNLAGHDPAIESVRKAEVESAFGALDDWISSNGLAGYDPYDIRGQDWYIAAFRSRNVRSALALIEQNLPPQFIRKVLRIKKAVNAKGLGLIASAYLRRFRGSGDLPYLHKAEALLEWLAANQSVGYPGCSWGYPFHWHSRIFIPRNTPSIVVTGTVADAWLDHFDLTGSSTSLQMAYGIGQFITEGLKRSFEDSDRLCFSYTPIDNFQVTNATLFGAAFLARLGALTKDEKYSTLAEKSVRYALSQQNADGSFCYWGFEPGSIIDHYHTGFILRHLFTVRKSLGLEWVSEPLKRGYRFYLEKLFTASQLPKFTPGNFYPVDVHSFAEALLCIGTLGQEFGGLDRLGPTFAFAQRQLRSPQGWYIAGIRKRWWGLQRLEVPYLRWAQAWMLLALALLWEALCESE
jgi:hypothetical protein